MRISARQLRLAAVAALIAVLSSCGHAATKLAIDDRATPTPTSVTMPTTTTTVDKAAVTRWNVAVWNNAVWVNAVKHAERASHATSSGGATGNGASLRAPRTSAVSVPTDIASVMACIRAHESGNYDEHSHAGGSSGAYQYEPQTWQAWSARAGYPGYALAYLAPASVQDAVTAYALTHGGAGNWSDRFGNDPCTSSLPGGG